MDWVRLLEWEALQGTGKVIDEKERRAVVARGLERIRQPAGRAAGCLANTTRVT